LEKYSCRKETYEEFSKKSNVKEDIERDYFSIKETSQTSHRWPTTSDDLNKSSSEIKMYDVNFLGALAMRNREMERRVFGEQKCYSVNK